MRRWSYIVLAPLTLACASVLGLEEARLEEDDGDVDQGGRSSQGSSGNDGNRAGTTARAGAGQSGGTGGTGALACNYGEDEPGECFWSCVNGPCCQQSSDCLENAQCLDYLRCYGDCEDDFECTVNCAMSYPDGRTRADALTVCLSRCCPIDREGGSGAGGGPSTGGSGGTGGTTNTTCRVGDPSVCASATSVRYCEEGKPRTVACTTRCEEVGLDPGDGMCSNDVCQCGDPLDTECAIGAFAYCKCGNELLGESCGDVELSNLYYRCYHQLQPFEEVARCAAIYASESPIDCENLLYFCTPDDL